MAVECVASAECRPRGEAGKYVLKDIQLDSTYIRDSTALKVWVRIMTVAVSFETVVEFSCHLRVIFYSSVAVVGQFCAGWQIYRLMLQASCNTIALSVFSNRSQTKLRALSA
jgi:hypothetical protein